MSGTGRVWGSVCVLMMLVMQLACGGTTSTPPSAPAAAPPPSSSAGAAGSKAQRSNIPGLTPQQFAEAFVTRSGSRLFVTGQPFRFAGANIEFLGLKNYGPFSSATLPVGSEQYPSQYEVDDALATAHEMGATAVRAQTMGDTVGCPLCIEPTLGVFNDAAFAQMDMVVSEARKYGIKIFGEFDGDANGTGSGYFSHTWYCIWRNISSSDCNAAFFSNPDLIADYERHMKAVLTHVNPLTGLAYKDDPIFVGWADGNVLGGASPDSVAAWLATISSYFKSIDSKHLFVDISQVGVSLPSPPLGVLEVPGVDMYAQEWYPHWDPALQADRIDGLAPELHQLASAVAASGKAYATLEYGWDHTDYLDQAGLKSFLDGLAADTNVVGDNFWALLSHADGHGWQPIPANAQCQPSCETIEDGNWWALYYTGVTTLSNQAADMAARAQIIRAHAYSMASSASVPPHETVPAPVITSVSGGKVLFQGAAGSPTYSVQKQGSNSSWNTVCEQCVTDAEGGWTDTAAPACYRLQGINLDGIPGPYSASSGTGCTP